MSPAVAMAHWLGTGEAPYAFTIDRECELKSADEMKSVVRYARHPLDTDEVKQHIVSGKMPATSRANPLITAVVKDIRR